MRTAPLDDDGTVSTFLHMYMYVCCHVICQDKILIRSVSDQFSFIVAVVLCLKGTATLNHPTNKGQITKHWYVPGGGFRMLALA